jgi:hypothetical protein
MTREDATGLLAQLALREDDDLIAQKLVSIRCTHSYVMPHIFCPTCRKRMGCTRREVARLRRAVNSPSARTA